MYQNNRFNYRDTPQLFAGSILYRDSDMRRLRSTKKPITEARPKWGPDFNGPL